MFFFSPFSNEIICAHIAHFALIDFIGHTYNNKDQMCDVENV